MTLGRPGVTGTNDFPRLVKEFTLFFILAVGTHLEILSKHEISSDLHI